MGGEPSRWESSQLRDFRAQSQSDPALADAVMACSDAFPPAHLEPERVIRTSRENAERAVCRALARAALWRELWRVEIMG